MKCFQELTILIEKAMFSGKYALAIAEYFVSAVVQITKKIILMQIPSPAYLNKVSRELVNQKIETTKMKVVLKLVFEALLAIPDVYEKFIVVYSPADSARLHHLQNFIELHQVNVSQPVINYQVMDATVGVVNLVIDYFQITELTQDQLLYFYQIYSHCISSKLTNLVQQAAFGIHYLALKNADH